MIRALAVTLIGPGVEAFLDRFAAAWRRLEPGGSGRRCNVAFSGGVDSAVLLAAVRRLEPRRPIRAIHVDHGLQPSSADWPEACRRATDAAGAELVVRCVHVNRNAPSGVEAAAREVRYAAFAAVLEPGESLLTAHHADDQLETMLMRLFRGTGPGGLAGVRESAELGRVRVLRPFLEFTRAEIEAQARAWSLDWIEDPSNLDARFDRNYVRGEIMPAIVRRWPGAPAAAVRTGRQMAAAEQLLEDVAAGDVAAVAEPETDAVAVDGLRALSAARRDNALRYLIRRAGLPLPTAAQLETLAGALSVERRDAETRVAWPGAEARVHRGRLYLLAPLPDNAPPAETRLAPGRAWRGPVGRLELAQAAPGAPGLPESWLAPGLEIRLRTGGERLRPLGDSHTRELKKLLQDARIVPWMRDRIPLLYAGDALVAVADLWLADVVCEAPADELRYRVEWTDHPPLR